MRILPAARKLHLQSLQLQDRSGSKDTAQACGLLSRRQEAAFQGHHRPVLLGFGPMPGRNPPLLRPHPGLSLGRVRPEQLQCRRRPLRGRLCREQHHPRRCTPIPPPPQNSRPQTPPKAKAKSKAAHDMDITNNCGWTCTCGAVNRMPKCHCES